MSVATHATACGRVAGPPGNPTLWLRESEIVGSPITSWKSVGSAGGTFSAATTARPAAVAMDGRTCAQFDGAANAMSGGPILNTVINAAQYTIGCIVRPDALTGPNHSSGTAGWNMRPVITDVTNGEWWPSLFNATGATGGHNGSAAPATEIAVVAGTEYYVEADYDGTTYTLRVNGGTQTLARGNVAAPTQALRLGANFNLTVFLQATIGEIVAYNTQLSATDRTALSTYLKGRFPSAT